MASCSSRDYFGNWKALHYTAKDVFAPISLSQKLDKNEILSIWMMTDLAEEIQDTLIISIYNIDGKITRVITEPINRQVKGSLLIFSKKIKLNQDQFIITELKKLKIHSKTLFSSKIKQLNLKKPNISYLIERNIITLQTDIPAFEVYLHGIKGSLSDNFFTLLPGKEKIIEIEPSVFNPNNLLIWSLYDLNKN